jgi:hypothetical protein
MTSGSPYCDIDYYFLIFEIMMLSEDKVEDILFRLTMLDLEEEYDGYAYKSKENILSLFYI